MATYNNKSINMHQSNDLLNYYLTMNINNICRICLEKGPKLMPIFDPVKPPHFSILIMACAAVQVLEGDGLPPYICQKCISKLNNAFQFKTQCENSDAKLRLCFQQYQQLPDTTDLSSLIELKKDDSNNSSIYGETNDGNTCLQQKQDNINIHPNTEMHNTTCLVSSEAHILQAVQINPPVNALYDIDKNTLNELKPDLMDLKPTDESMKMDEITIINISNIPQKSKKNTKQHQCDTCNKIFRTKPGLVHHIRIHTGERPYVCHLCEKRFINGGHLHTHMRTHTGEKNHICAACNKGFATAQQLTKHTIAIHTSERPYGCSYCPKRFASSSNLNTHTKIHTGEKNYHCDQCGKAFSTKGQLYQHMLVHSGEKAYLCEYCNKRFSQKAHLIRHLKTHSGS